MPKVRASSSIGLREALAAIQRGGIESLPRRNVQIPLEELGQEEILALLEIARLKSFGPGYAARLDRLLGPSTGGTVGELQLMESLVEGGSFAKVLNRFTERPVSHEHPDLHIQKIRAQIFTGDFKTGLAAVGLLLKQDLDLNTRGVAHQLMGHCLMELGDFQSALDSLDIASDIASAVGNRHGKLACELFRAKTYCLIDELGEAQARFQEALRHVAPADENFRWLTGLYRTWSFLLFCQGDPGFLDRALAAVKLSSSMGDAFYAERSEIECVLMLRSSGLEVGSEYMEELKARTESSGTAGQGDVPTWLEALTTPARAATASWPMSLRFLARKGDRKLIKGRASELGARLKSATVGDSAKASWILDRENAWLIDLVKKTHRTFVDQSPALKLIELLSKEPRGIPVDSAFERAWDLRWNEAMHGNTIAVTISRLNAKDPSYGISRKRGVLAMSRAGMIVG